MAFVEEVSRMAAKASSKQAKVSRIEGKRAGSRLKSEQEERKNEQESLNVYLNSEQIKHQAARHSIRFT